jgi:hypothetical protein
VHCNAEKYIIFHVGRATVWAIRYLLYNIKDTIIDTFYWSICVLSVDLSLKALHCCTIININVYIEPTRGSEMRKL